MLECNKDVIHLKYKLITNILKAFKINIKYIININHGLNRKETFAPIRSR
jgi:hypothetical protein